MNENPRLDRLPIDSLTPCRHRNAGGKRRQRLLASLRAVGLLSPLVVHARGDGYDILDGHLRYEILCELGKTTIPCFVLKEVQNHE